MLIQFVFKNYRSFKNEATLDLSASKITEFSDRVIQIGDEKVLPAAVIYGANASGKSNVYRAFCYMSEFVANSFSFGDNDKKYLEQLPEPFLFDANTESAESSFEVYFTLPFDESGRVFNYGFSLGREGVVEEWLNSKTKTARKYKPIIYRSNLNGESILELPGITKAKKDLIELTLNKQVLVISLGAKLKIEKCKLVFDWFGNNVFTDFADIAHNLYMFRSLPDHFVDEEQTRSDVLKFFSSFDNQIKSFIVKKMDNSETGDKDLYVVNSLHEKTNSNEMAQIPLQEESAGTLKMFALYPDLKYVMETGGVFFVDELNARLHPLLVRNIILTFLNPAININHAQIVFTTHDTWQLSNDLFRRDEVWFVSKDDQGVSSLYSLVDFKENGFKIRKDESYEKNYLLGKYGAIPSMKMIDLLSEDSDVTRK